MINQGANRGKILAIDYGTTKIGLAVSDDARLLAFGRGVIDRGPGGGGFEKLVFKLRAICEKDGVVEFVFGLALNAEGEEGESAGRVRNFAAKLGSHFPDQKFNFIDESFSSFEAKKLQQEAGSHGYDDEFAAKIILQRFLDGHVIM